MADQGGPNKFLQRAELEVQLAQQELNIKSAQLRLTQIEEEAKKIEHNMQAAKKAKAALVERLNSLGNLGE